MRKVKFVGVLDTPVSGMDAFQQMLSTVGNNIANMNTVAYKESQVQFADLLSQTLANGGAGTTAGIGGVDPQQVGLGVKVGSTSSNFGEGSITQTGNQSDLLINGSGFFAVSPNATGSPIYYTRAGNFHVDSNGNVVTPSGYYLLATSSATSGTPPTWSAVNINDTTTGAPSQYTINGNGVIQVQGGKTFYLQLSNFENPNGLLKVGGNLYQALPGGDAGAVTYGQGGTSGLGTVQQGMLESSNVDLSAEMSKMIEAQTGYNANSKVINTVQQMYQFMLNQV